jgi:hypothetical protein
VSKNNRRKGGDFLGKFVQKKGKKLKDGRVGGRVLLMKIAGWRDELAPCMLMSVGPPSV